MIRVGLLIDQLPEHSTALVVRAVLAWCIGIGLRRLLRAGMRCS